MFQSNIQQSVEKSLSPYKRISISKSPAKVLNNWLLSPKKLKARSNAVKGLDESVLNLKKSDIKQSSEIELENKYVFKNSDSLSKLLLRNDSDENRKENLRIFKNLRKS